MLVLSRKIGEKIYIGPEIEVVVVEVDRGKVVRLGIKAPAELKIFRSELVDGFKNKEVLGGTPGDNHQSAVERSQSQQADANTKGKGQRA